MRTTTSRMTRPWKKAMTSSRLTSGIITPVFGSMSDTRQGPLVRMRRSPPSDVEPYNSFPPTGLGDGFFEVRVVSHTIVADLDSIVEWSEVDPVLLHGSQHLRDAGCPGVADAGKTELLDECGLLFIGLDLGIPGARIHGKERPFGLAKG